MIENDRLHNPSTRFVISPCLIIYFFIIERIVGEFDTTVEKKRGGFLFEETMIEFLIVCNSHYFGANIEVECY